MKQTKRQLREQETIDNVIRICDTMTSEINMPVQTHEDAAEYLKILFTNGMRLAKYREQIELIKSENDIADEKKTVAINAVDDVLKSIISLIGKSFSIVKETSK